MTNDIQTAPRLRWNWLILIAITLFAVVLRILLIERGATLDEMTSFMLFGRINLLRALTNYASPNNHLLHTLLMQGSYRLIGIDLWMLRLPAFIAGILTISVAYWAGSSLYRSNVGLVAAALIAISLPMIDYATQARGYSLYVLFFCVQIALAAALLKHPRTWHWVAFALVCALGFYTIPLYVFPCGIVCLWLFLSILIEQRGRDRINSVIRFMVAVAAGGLLTLALYAPIWTQADGINQLFNNADIRTLRVDTVAPTTTTTPTTTVSRALTPAYIQTLRGMVNYPASGFSTPVIISFGVLALIGILGQWRIGRHKFPLWLAAILWLVPAAIVLPIFIPERTWIFLIPVYASMIAAGYTLIMEFILRRSRVAPIIYGGFAVVVIAVLATTIMSSRAVAQLRSGVSPDAEAVALALGEMYTENDTAFIPFPHSAPVRYYLLYHDYFEDNVIASDRNAARDTLKTFEGRIFAYIPNIWRRDLFFLEFFRLDIGGLNIRIIPIQTFENGVLSELMIE